MGSRLWHLRTAEYYRAPRGRARRAVQGQRTLRGAPEASLEAKTARTVSLPAAAGRGRGDEQDLQGRENAPSDTSPWGRDTHRTCSTNSEDSGCFGDCNRLGGGVGLGPAGRLRDQEIYRKSLHFVLNVAKNWKT